MDAIEQQTLPLLFRHPRFLNISGVFSCFLVFGAVFF